MENQVPIKWKIFNKLRITTANNLVEILLGKVRDKI